MYVPTEAKRGTWPLGAYRKIAGPLNENNNKVKLSLRVKRAQYFLNS